MKRSLLQFAALAVCLSGLSTQLRAGDDLVFDSRHVPHYVRPSLPEIAKRMNLKGSVKLEVEISANGKVTAIKPVGGHPLLLNSATLAVKDWVFDTAPQATTALVTVAFQ